MATDLEEIGLYFEEKCSKVSQILELVGIGRLKKNMRSLVKRLVL